MSTRARPTAVDLAVALLLVVVTLVYLGALPRNLNPSDEAVHLYEAKRLLSGQVMYRDVFEIITPLWMYLMAALFWLFGTDITTARLGMAAMHAVTVVLIGLTCRRLLVRPVLAWAAAFSYLALCQSAWPIASQHWLSTLLCVAVLFVLAQMERRHLLLAGVLLGCLIGVQQQRGVIMAVGVALWCAVDAWLPSQTEDLSGNGGTPIWRRWLALAIGIGAVVGPLLLAMVIMAGFTPVWRALVVHPIVNYGGQTHCPWGYANILTLEYSRMTFLNVVVWLPAVLALTAARLAVGLVRGGDAVGIRRLTLLLMLSAFAILSIAYFPDFIHITFILPLVLIAAAEIAEWSLQWLPDPSIIGRAAATVAAAAVILVCAHKLRQNALILHATYPLVQQTAFGRVAMQTARDVALYQQIDTLLDTTPTRALYSYPIVAHWYLLADADNPTRYGFFLASYNAPDQVREVLDVLAERRLPYIVSLPPTSIKDDPIFAYLARDYEPLPEDVPPGYRVYRRKTDAGTNP